MKRKMRSCNYVKTSKHFKSCITKIYLKVEIGRLKKCMIEVRFNKRKKSDKGRAKAKQETEKRGKFWVRDCHKFLRRE